MPLITCMGAAGKGSKGDMIHKSWSWGDLGMGAYEFGLNEFDEYFRSRG
jgi:4,5-DOPA dioxygenase extradiol